VAHAAVARAKAGLGPTLIEARTYRLSFHNTSDNPKQYQTEAELDEAKRRDPIPRLQRYLATRGRWDEARGLAMREEADQKILAAISAAELLPPNTPDDVFSNVYATPSPRMLSQRDELLRTEKDG
jgi:pyruvate dehydrogenase E1 component alpha subunit